MKRLRRSTNKRKTNKVEQVVDGTAAQKASEERFFEIEQKHLKQEMEANGSGRYKKELDHEMRLITQMISCACRPYSAPWYHHLSWMGWTAS